MFSFGPWQDGSDDAKDMLWLLQEDDIWEPQARDGDSREAARGASFPGAWLALYRDGTSPLGYILYIPRNPVCTVLEQHTAFITRARGQVAARVIENATAAVFLQTPCSRIVTFCPDWHPASKYMARHMGATPVYRKENFAERQGKKFGAELYSQSVLEWAFRNHHKYAEIGKAWHDSVFAKLEPHHEDDAAHDGFVGLAVTMGKYQPHKAVAVYNTWAELAGYAPAQVGWSDMQGNALIDIANAYVVNNGNRAVAAFPKCQPLQPSAPL